jgi:hypothetical protein
LLFNLMKHLIVLLLFTLQARAEWQPLAPMPAPNGGFACGFIDHQLILVGGTNWAEGSKHWLDVIWCYDAGTNQWKTIGKLSRPWAYGAGAVMNGKLVIGGGTDGLKARHELTTIGNDGTIKNAGYLEEALIFTCGTMFENRFTMCGGATDPDRLSTLKSRVVSSGSDHGDYFNSMHSSGFNVPGFGIATAAVADNTLFVFGGAQYDATTQIKNLNAVLQIPEENDHKRHRGTLATPLPNAIRGLCSSTVTDKLIYLGGGYVSDEIGFTDEAWLFDAVEQKFKPAPPLPMKAMTQLVQDGDWLYCLGGQDRKQQRTDKVWRIRITELLAAPKH